jgi:hypothetical protein
MNLAKLFYFNELTPAAQEQARINVMIPEVEAKARKLEKARQAYRENPHKAINDAMHIISALPMGRKPSTKFALWGISI